ncbi:MAG TPA: AAA family ATPase [Candidatus Limnocylindrales bacterium]|nr:AAA family ATPase [Candidatus Limnocylindrales bacterium]
METVVCPSCGEDNPAKFRLCGFCGTSLAPAPETIVCASCGEENPSKFRLCGFCGTPLAAGTPSGAIATAHATPAAPAAPPAPARQPAPADDSSNPFGSLLAPAPSRPATSTPILPAQEIRKIVTLLFTDIKDSTALTGSIDAEAMNEIKARYFSSMAAEIERHGGEVEKNIGDAIMAIFGRLRAHEDDAMRAVRASHGMQKTLAALNEDFERYYGVRITNRTGVNTGEIVANLDPGATQNLATGDAVNVTARLEQNAPAGEILIGEVTYELVKQQVEVERLELTLKGKPDPVPAFRLIDVRSEPTPVLAAAAAPFVGREAELDVLRAAYAEIGAKRVARLVAVIGDAGVGKTRLISDFMAAVRDDAAVYRGRCLAYGDGITFWPLVEVVRSAARIGEDDSPATAIERIAALVPDDDPERDAIVDRVASAVGLASRSHPVAELFWGVRKLFEAQAALHPLVILIDDIHWAESTFLDLLDHLTESVRDAPILILCSARPEVAEVHAEWLASSSVERVELKPLGAAEVETMIDRLLAGTEVPPETKAKVIAAAEGNPLYIEQIVTLLRERDPGAGGDVVVPPTISALLAARLDGLSRAERAVVDPAAVIGLSFPGAAITHLVPDAIRNEVDDHLIALDRKQFVHPVTTDANAEADDLHRFHHILVRDATYQGLLKRTRASLHERFVEWAEPVNRERGRETEFEEILGYHLEQAVRYRSELGPLDDAGRAIADRAAKKLGNAGRRAFARGDLPAAANLLQRATTLLPETSTARIEMLLDLSAVLLENGDFGGSNESIEAARAAADTVGDERLVRHSVIARSIHAQLGTEVLGNAAEMIAETEAQIAWFEAANDDVGLTHAWRLLAAIHGTAGRYDEAKVAIQGVMAAARKTGDTRAANRGAIAYAVLSLHGDEPVPDALRACAALSADVAGDRKSEAVILGIRALLTAMDGDVATAREMAASGRAMVADLGPSISASTTSTEAARIELLADDPAAAAALLERDLAELEALGERYFRSTIAGLHAQARIEMGDVAGAESSVELAQSLADPDDTEAQVLWRSAQARILAARGSVDEALACAARAVALADETSDPALQAETRLDQGRVLLALGRQTDAEPPLREALALFERKVVSVRVPLVERLLAEGATALPASVEG